MSWSADITTHQTNSFYSVIRKTVYDKFRLQMLTTGRITFVRGQRSLGSLFGCQKHYVPLLYSVVYHRVNGKSLV